MADGRCNRPPLFPFGGSPPLADGLRLFAAVSAGMGVVTYLAMELGAPLLVGSFGASACLLYFVPAGPFSQPRNVIGGHTLAALTGVAVSAALGCTWYGAALGVGGAVVVMVYTGTMHPPAAATALVAVLTGQGAAFVLAPVAVGAATLMLAAIIINRLLPKIAQRCGLARKKEVSR